MSPPQASEGHVSMKQLILHIGMHKTGTTSIQWYLNRHARKLKGYGTYVPQAGCPSSRSSGHHNIPWLLLGDARANPEWGSLDDLLAEIDRANPLQAVVSSEEFEFLADRPAELARLENRIVGAGWSPVYLLFLRSPGAYAVSVFHELVKQNAPVTFAEFLEKVLADGTFTSPGNLVLHLDYDLFVSKWRAATAGALRIISYDAGVAGRGVIPTFMGALDVPARLAELRQRRLNVGASEVTEEMRAGARAIDEKYAPAFRRQIGAG